MGPSGNVLARRLIMLAVLPVAQGSEVPAADDLLKLEGAEFVKGAEEASYGFYGDTCPYSADQLIALARRLGAEVRKRSEQKEGDGSSNPFGIYFTQACLRAEEAQIPALVETYTRLDPGSFEKSNVLFALASRVLAREVAAIRAEGSQVVLISAAVDPPAGLRSAPRELQDAGHSYFRARLRSTKRFVPRLRSWRFRRTKKRFTN
jgi:hypothetical protein